MDAQRFPLDIPVDHDAPAAVAHLPLGRKVLVPSAEVLGIGRAGGCAFAPDSRVAGIQRALVTIPMARRIASTVMYRGRT